MTTEEWRSAPGHEGYEVSSRGRIRGPRGINMGSLFGGPGCGYTAGGPYRIANIRHKRVRIHRLVCEAFNGPAPFEGAMVRHLDGDSLNNVPENLAWGTHAENVEDRTRHGRTLRGEMHGRARLTAAQVAEIRRRLALRPRVVQRRIAEEFGVTESTISSIKLGGSWGGAAV